MPLIAFLCFLALFALGGILWGSVEAIIQGEGFGALLATMSIIGFLVFWGCVIDAISHFEEYRATPEQEVRDRILGRLMIWSGLVCLVGTVGVFTVGF